MKKWVIKRSWPNTDKLEVWEFIDTEEEARKYWYVSQYLDKYGVENELPLAMNDLGGFHSLHNIMDRIVRIVESDEKPRLDVHEAYGVNEENFKCGWIAPNGTTYSCCSYEHYNLANTLCYRDYGNTTYYFEDELFNDPDGKLLYNGWVKVTYTDYYADYDKMTDAQAEVLLKQGYKTNMYESFKKLDNKY
jgi:hypothetical protein